LIIIRVFRVERQVPLNLGVVEHHNRLPAGQFLHDPQGPQVSLQNLGVDGGLDPDDVLGALRTFLQNLVVLEDSLGF
jgi:hypothetical protein